MAPGDVLARNLITRPTFDDVAVGSDAVGWLRGSGSAAPDVGVKAHSSAGGAHPDGVMTFKGSDAVGLAVSTSLGARVAGEVLSVWLDYIRIATYPDTVASVDLVTDRAAAIPVAGPACVKATTEEPFTLTVPADGDYFLRIAADGSSFYNQVILLGIRVDLLATPDTYGIFSGATPDTEEVDYEWEGEPFLSTSLAKVPAGEEPPVDPPVVPADVVGQVMTLLGTSKQAQVEIAVMGVTAMVREYTRGRGFAADGTYTDGIRAVIVTATCRLLGNPEQVDHGLGQNWTRGSFQGWTLAEQFVLNAYRKRAV